MADQQVRRRLSEEKMNRGIGMLKAGLSQREVARVLGVSQSVVSRMWTRFHLTGNVMHQHAGSRERSTTRAQDRFITLQARRHRFNNVTTLCSELQNATDVRLSTQTIRNRLHEAGLRSRRPAIRIPLTRHHVQELLEWARDHVTWALNDWTLILFTDESRFCVDFTDRRARVGGCEMNVLLKFVLQSMIAMAGVQLWCGRELALRGKRTCTSSITAH